MVSEEAPHVGAIWQPSLFDHHQCIGGTWRRANLTEVVGCGSSPEERAPGSV